MNLRRHQEDANKMAAIEALRRFFLAREASLALTSMRAMEHHGVRVDDEILLHGKCDHVLTVVAIEGGQYFLKIRYGSVRMVDLQRIENPYDPMREYWISGTKLSAMLDDGRGLHIRPEPSTGKTSPAKDTTLLEICAKAVSRADLHALPWDEIPLHLRHLIGDLAKDLAPIPVACSIRAASVGKVRTGRAASSDSKDAGGPLLRSTIIPASLAYFAVWSACADAIFEREVEATGRPRADWLDLRPARGAAAFMAAYVAACRRGEALFELELECGWDREPQWLPRSLLPQRDYLPKSKGIGQLQAVRAGPRDPDSAPRVSACCIRGAWYLYNHLMRGPCGRWRRADELAPTELRRVGFFHNLGAE